MHESINKLVSFIHVLEMLYGKKKQMELALYCYTLNRFSPPKVALGADLFGAVSWGPIDDRISHTHGPGDCVPYLF
jgi:hypothetical protein